MSESNVNAIRATVLAVLAVCIVPAETAHAQFRFWPHYGPWWSQHAPVRYEHRHRPKKPHSGKKEQVRETPTGPLQIVVSIADQRIAVYDNAALIARASVSTGVPRHPPPLGVFSVIGKKRWHRSNLYSAAPMPYMQRLTWSGIALHAGVLPGYPASHGCIRLKRDFAIRLWQLTRRGTRVIIAPDDIRPLEIANPRLFAAKPQASAGQLEFPAASADNAVMTAAAAQSASAPDADAQQVTDRRAPGSTRPEVAPPNAAPISVFVSRKLSRLFVRQGFTSLFDIPVRIQDPGESLGTHVFTAMGFQNEGAALRWTVTSMPEKSPHVPQASKKRTPGNQIVEATPAVSSPDKANAALDRIEIPQHIVEHISERLTPGSSLIVTDHGISQETGKGTDFIVVMQ